MPEPPRPATVVQEFRVVYRRAKGRHARPDHRPAGVGRADRVLFPADEGLHVGYVGFAEYAVKLRQFHHGEFERLELVAKLTKLQGAYRSRAGL